MAEFYRKKKKVCQESAWGLCDRRCRDLRGCGSCGLSFVPANFCRFFPGFHESVPEQRCADGG